MVHGWTFVSPGGPAFIAWLRARPEDAAPTSAARSDEAPGELNYEALPCGIFT